MTLWGQCPKCHHHLHDCTFWRPKGIQKSENCFACGFEEVSAVKEGGKGRWRRPDHTPQPDPPEMLTKEGKREQRRLKKEMAF